MGKRVAEICTWRFVKRSVISPTFLEQCVVHSALKPCAVPPFAGPIIVP